MHFDGELKAIVKKGIKKETAVGGHNHLVIGDKIKIRKYLSEPLDNQPFDALISVKNKRGQFIDKKNKSSMFPQNWDLTRVKEEIALVYEDLVLSGKDFTKFPFKHTIINSNDSFKILIEFDKFGNITNAYPYIKN